jgi:cysteate synthase
MRYQIACPNCHWIAPENTLPVFCPNCQKTALLKLTDFLPKSCHSGLSLYEYLPWFEQRGGVDASIGVFRLPKLEDCLGLSPVWIIFSGFWPAKNASLRSATFKDLEACSMIAWARQWHPGKVLLVSSAGNTGRAVFHGAVCAQQPAIIVVPESALEAFWIPDVSRPILPLIIAVSDGCYQDAMDVGKLIGAHFPEQVVETGGVYNVARRAAAGFPYFLGCMHIEDIPDHYVQSVASSIGAIAAYEVNTELIKAQGFAPKITKLHIVQNSPFTVITDAWNKGKKEIDKLSAHEIQRLSSLITAKVLSNASPPYSVVGGLYDTLVATQGCAYAVENNEIEDVRLLWESVAKIDLDPAALVTLVGLKQAVQQGHIRQGELVLLHITGGGLKKAIDRLMLTRASAFVKVGKDDVNGIIDAVHQYLTISCH